MDDFQVLLKPLLTEKSSALREGQHQFVFVVHPSANKIQVRHAIERVLKVKVENVNIMNVRGKQKRLGRFSGMRPGWRKAIVTLEPGAKLDLFEGA
jgi:large subunit ribosomal protein L23